MNIRCMMAVLSIATVLVLVACTSVPPSEIYADDTPNGRMQMVGYSRNSASALLSTSSSPQRALVITGYKVCQDPQTRQESIACGAADCPLGMRVIAWNSGTHWSCGTDDCVDMKALGWRGGHKTRFCQRAGYDGVKPKPGDYKKGGWCYRGDPGICG